MSKEKGFSLVELLVAMVILLIITNGFMMSFLTYYSYEIKVKIKKEASQVLRNVLGYLEALDYGFIDSFNVPAKFDNATCGSSGCSFESIDEDGDNIRDFYDPYNGDNNTKYSAPKTGFSSWLSVWPQTSGGSCSLPSLPFNCTYQVSGREIFVAITTSRMVDVHSREVGRALGVVVWYFEPGTNSYKALRGVVFKEKP